MTKYSGANIEPTLPEWAWTGWIPRGAISLLVGYDSIGKSTFAAYITSMWTRGELTGKKEIVHVSMLEDNDAAITVPRLMAAAADLNHVLFREPGKPSWNFPKDTEEFFRYLIVNEATIAVVDPLDHHVDNLSNQNGRKTLGDMAEKASYFGMTLLFLHHFNKEGRSIESAIGGGRGVRGVARSIMVLGAPAPETSIIKFFVPNTEDDEDDEDDPSADSIYLAHLKSSYGRTMTSQRYERESVPHPKSPADEYSIPRLSCEDENVTDVTAHDLWKRKPVDQTHRGETKRIAKELIIRFLADGPKLGIELASDVTVAGVSLVTFNRSRAELAKEGVIEQYQVNKQHWWRLKPLPDSLPPGWVK